MIKVKIIPLDENHDKYIVKWRNDPEISACLFNDGEISLKSHRKWFETYAKSISRKEFVIYISLEDIPIGTVGLSSIDNINRKAEYGILIGERQYAGKGYAKEASMLVMEYAFKLLNLNKVYLRVFEDNKRAVEMYKILGFSIDGISRQDIFKNGIFKNVIEMSILKEEWENVQHSDKS